MTTNVFLGFIFGVTSIVLHAILIFADARRSFVYYNVSLLFWVCGNFLWMTTEFVAVVPSTRIHTGPHVPLGGFSEDSIHAMIDAKTILFLISFIIQVLMYLGMYCRIIPSPEDFEVDIVARNEAHLLCYGRKSYESTPLESETIDGLAENDQVTLTIRTRSDNYLMTIAIIENAYLVFWLFKDFFWSSACANFGFATDEKSTTSRVIFYETGALLCGTATVSVVLVSAYLNRRHLNDLLDELTVIFWLSANFVWMCGEFFVRYKTGSRGDDDEGDDSNTRITSSVLFGLAFCIQAFVISRLYVSRRAQMGVGRFSTTIKMEKASELVKYDNIMISVTPQRQMIDHNPMHHAGLGFDDDDDMATVLF
jgi:hypothetical protein